MRDYYEILKVDPLSDLNVIQVAYRHLALMHHPDRSRDPFAPARMRLINEAYEVLSDPTKRGEYDRLRQQYDIETLSKHALERGMQALDGNEFAVAVLELSEALRLSPVNFKVYNNRAIAYVKLGMNKSAIDDFSVAIRINPSDSSLLRNRAKAYRLISQHALAEADDRRANQIRATAGVSPEGEETEAMAVAWQALPHVRDYYDRPLLGGIDFFRPPPESILPILFAYSNLTKGKDPLGPHVRLWFIVGAGIILALLGIIAGILVGGVLLQSLGWSIGLCLTGSAVGGAIGSIACAEFTCFRYECSYVGERGFARYQCNGSRSTISNEQLVCFEPGIACLLDMIRNYEKGKYLSTSYAFTWSSKKGAVANIEGTFKAENGMPVVHHEYCWARTAYHIWQTLTAAR